MTNASCISPDMSQNENDIQTGSDGEQQRSSDLNQEPPIIVATTPDPPNDNGYAGITSTEHGQNPLEKSIEHQLLETISSTLEAQNKLMAEQKRILEAVASKYKVPQSKQSPGQ